MRVHILQILTNFSMFWPEMAVTSVWIEICVADCLTKDSNE